MYNNRPQIKIGSKWSFEAWGAYLASGWSLASAKPKTSFLEVPARDGAIDTTDVLAGEPRYANRELAFSLIITAPESEWESIRQEIDNFCNGQRLPIVLPHDQSHYLIGRVSTGNMSRGSALSDMSINVTCDPWRYKNKETNINVVVPSGGQISRVLKNERRRVVPKIIASGSAAITINGITQNVSEGEFKFTDFILHPGKNPVQVQAAEGVSVRFVYQEASL